MKISLAIAVVAVLGMTLIPAIMDGQRRFRWGEDKEVSKLTNHVIEFPKQIGEWEATSEIPLDSSATNLLRPFAVTNRIYFNNSKSRQVQVFVLFGPTGPTAVHTPDICMDQRDFRSLGKRRSVSLGQSKSKCFEIEFVTRDVNANFVKSWYAWTTTGTWVASENPRYEFAKNRYLFKLQVMARYPDKQQMENDPDMDDFLTELEQALRDHIFYQPT